MADLNVSSVDASTRSVTSHSVQVGDTTLTLRDMAPDDVTAVLALHEHVFGPGADARWFAWKYGQGLSQGRGRAIGAWHDGQLVAYCGGLPRTLRLHNTNLRGLQIGDVMVHPAWRGILSRRGPFFQVSKRFYDSQIGATDSRPFELGFGFPNERHLRLAVLLGAAARLWADSISKVEQPARPQLSATVVLALAASAAVQPPLRP